MSHKMELTPNEIRMSTEGIIYSTEEPNALFIKEGADNGPYVCYAFAAKHSILLQLTDMTVGNGKPFVMFKTPIGNIKINSHRNLKESGWCELYNTKGEFIDKICFADRYEGLAMDVQARLFFADFLRMFLKEKEKNKNSTTI